MSKRGVHSYLHLRKKHKRWGKKAAPKVSVKSGMHKVLSRYLAASQDHFKQCESVCIAMDASRVGGKDLLLLALFGTTKAGVSRACRAPPQALPPALALTFE